MVPVFFVVLLCRTTCNVKVFQMSKVYTSPGTFPLPVMVTGREDMCRTLAETAGNNTVVLVHGASGCGKSVLINLSAKSIMKAADSNVMVVTAGRKAGPLAAVSFHLLLCCRRVELQGLLLSSGLLTERRVTAYGFFWGWLRNPSQCLFLTMCIFSLLTMSNDLLQKLERPSTMDALFLFYENVFEKNGIMTKTVSALK